MRCILDPRQNNRFFLALSAHAGSVLAENLPRTWPTGGFMPMTTLMPEMKKGPGPRLF
jgi:hypothetical protein